MAEVRPFRGLRYNPSVVEDLSRVVCPPYDIILPSQETILQQRSPYNAVRLELREPGPSEVTDPGRYLRAAALFRQWLARGVLAAETSPAMYLVEEEFTYRGNTIRRQGLMAVVRLEEFEKGVVLPHEHTRPGPKADRMALMKACHANISPIMGLYRDPDGMLSGLSAQVRRKQPAASAAPDGQAGYMMWQVTEPALLSKITEVMASRRIYVADGHHRYETALNYRRELEASGGLDSQAAGRFVMATLVSMDDPGLLVLPYHRTIGGLSGNELAAFKHRLGELFSAQPLAPFPRNAGAVQIADLIDQELARQPGDEVTIGVLGLEPGRGHILKPRKAFRPAGDSSALERCDTWFLHHRVIRPALGEEREGAAIGFVHDPAEAVGSILGGSAQLALLLRPLDMGLFEEVVGKGERLPPKSTYFYPKLPTGLVFNSLEGELKAG